MWHSHISGFDLGFGSRGAGNEDSHARTKIYVLAIIELVKMAFAALQLRIKCGVQISCPYNIVMCLSKSMLVPSHISHIPPHPNDPAHTKPVPV